jgi:hypothetical protein
MSATGRHSDLFCAASHTQPRLFLSRRTPAPLCGALLFAVVGSALWLGRSPELAGTGGSFASSAGVWAEGLRGSSLSTDTERREERCTVTETRDRCELALRLAAPDGATIAAFECTYERMSQAKSPAKDAESDSASATDRKHWVWMAWALVPIVLACLLLPEPKE